MAVVGIQPSIWVCKYHKYYKQNICSVHLKLIKVKNNFGDFSGNPQKLPWIPRKFGLSKSPKYVPKPRNCFPRPHPENRRFSGFFPRKNPKNLPSPVPTPSPKILKKFPRPHPVPELRGGGRGSPGIGVTIAHSNVHSAMVVNGPHDLGSYGYPKRGQIWPNQIMIKAVNYGKILSISMIIVWNGVWYDGRKAKDCRLWKFCPLLGISASPLLTFKN